MSDGVLRADEYKRKLIKNYGQRMLTEDKVDTAFEEASKLAVTMGAHYVQKHLVRFVGQMDGARVASAAEVLFVRFGQGTDAAWAALAAFTATKDAENDQVWVGVYRPLTQETATMAWLDAYVTGELPR